MTWLLAQDRNRSGRMKPLGVAVIFLPEDDAAPRGEIESALAAQELRRAAWRPVPVRPEVLGEIANSVAARDLARA